MFSAWNHVAIVVFFGISVVQIVLQCCMFSEENGGEQPPQCDCGQRWKFCFGVGWHVVQLCPKLLLPVEPRSPFRHMWFQCLLAVAAWIKTETKPSVTSPDNPADVCNPALVPAVQANDDDVNYAIVFGAIKLFISSAYAVTVVVFGVLYALEDSPKAMIRLILAMIFTAAGAIVEVCFGCSALRRIRVAATTRRGKELDGGRGTELEVRDALLPDQSRRGGFKW
mmetsp:Transcript_19458/g.39437  ORF Transcript_19458/g.39437 Transcript_19458/m.39437 type:complete len:225 (+) Transcript_19458:158-832(+)|eukprot:CAMPEP_0202834116 /NCGR_PEP_ID=MMETSP1389-20130828/30404_1 /ASSEMBLY_ACC=CAM_ASM_000865 /TAXON_ID=302021 /ORGANISM="Rhodomonas sp., Strain CCMP768" /LENGTH=224 /DNA_ID=CAMNT_0049509145 /DNA_START=154 /DNA_END=828 /DNA_ORIENTATION=+